VAILLDYGQGSPFAPGTGLLRREPVPFVRATALRHHGGDGYTGLRPVPRLSDRPAFARTGFDMDTGVASDEDGERCATQKDVGKVVGGESEGRRDAGRSFGKSGL
jgi:hypothetical protein